MERRGGHEVKKGIGKKRGTRREEGDVEWRGTVSNNRDTELNGLRMNRTCSHRALFSHRKIRAPSCTQSRFKR